MKSGERERERYREMERERERIEGGKRDISGGKVGKGKRERGRERREL